MKSATGPSLEPSGDAVKEAKPGLLEGWELGAITVGLVLAAALLAVPRAASPGLFPVPLIDGAEARASRERLAALADRAEAKGLPFETRAVGDALRRIGTALSGGGGDTEFLNRLLLDRVRVAFTGDQVAELEQLRAVQARLFVRAVRAQRWERPPSTELAQLGGDFAGRALRNGWIAGGRCVASDDELTALFVRRWVDLTHLRDAPQFKATLGELRRYYRFLLLYPERGAGADAPNRERALARLRYVEALARRDTEYPLALARGSLLAQLGMMEQSAQALSDDLSRPSGSEWNLRARNYLLYAARGQEADPSAVPVEEP